MELLLLGVGSGLLEAVQLLVVVLAHWGGLLGGLVQRLVGAWLVLVGLAEWVRRQPLVQGEFAGVQRNALCNGGQRGGDGGGELLGVVPP